MKLLINTLEKLNIPYDDRMITQFKAYMEGILEWNDKVNLTSITEESEFVKKHYIDSVICCAYPEFQSASKIIDIGTGAGFPGIPLAILNPDKEFFLLDSLNKRIKIIEELAETIGLSNIKLCHGRAEEIARKKECREQFDFCVSRAVANLSVLTEYCLPFVKVGGWFAAYKSEGSEEEIKDSIPAIRILGGSLKETRSSKMDGFDLDHNIVMITKIKNTLAKYPRKAGTPAKEPLK